MSRALAAAACMMVLALGARPGLAQKRPGRRHGCQAAYRTARKHHHAGELVKALRQYRACARPKCGVFIEHQCTVSFGRIESEMPSVVPTATDPSGKPVVDVKFLVDGQILASRLDGRAVAIDPGMHELSFQTEAGVVGRRRTMILQGQRNRRIAVSVPAPRIAAAPPEAASPTGDGEQPIDAAPPPDVALVAPPPEPRAQSRWFTPTSYALLGVGVAGIGGYGLLTYWGRKDNDELSQCAPNCLQSSVDHIQNLYLAADVSLGVGVAALLGGAYLVWRHHASYAVEVQPTAGGAVAGISGAF